MTSTHVFHRSLRQTPPVAVGGEGVYLIDSAGRRYLDASGVVHAANLQGPLLMIVGEQDSNVDPASTFQVADALIKAGKDFDLLVVPGGEHSVGRSTGPIDYVQRRQFRFFLDKLAPPAP